MEISEITDPLRRGVVRMISRATPAGSCDGLEIFRRSSHPSREFLFVISGSNHYLFNDSVYSSEPGTLFLIDSGLPHGHCYTGEDAHLIHLWGHFSTEPLQISIIEVTTGGQYRTCPGINPIYMPEGIHSLLMSRWNLLSQCGSFSEETVEHYLKTPFNAVLDEVAFQIGEQSCERSRHNRMDEIKDYILSRNGRECSLENLSMLFGYTRCYLAHKFRSSTGISIGKYIDLVRLNYIRTMRKRGIRQKEMAYELGFSSPASFWNYLQRHKDQLVDIDGEQH